MADSDQAEIRAWTERCERLGVALGIAPALRLAVKLAETLPDNDVKRGYA
jgi:hypothetical protein